MQEVEQFFREQFGSPPSVFVQAPGRLELLGNHTDYNEGLVMSLAADKYIYIVSQRRNDGRIELASTAFEGRETFPFDRIDKNPAAPWADYVKGVLVQLRERGVRFTGFNAAIHGTIPLGAGMSSSAALEIASALTVRRLFPFHLTETRAVMLARNGENAPAIDKQERMSLAKLCQTAESEFVGVNCGLLDQISSLYGKASQVIQIDCRHLSIEHQPLPAGVAVVVCDSGVKHSLAAGDYNALRRHCESAARSLGVRALRSVTPEELRAKKNRLNERDYECACHVVGENQRVLFGERALRQGDIRQFGQFLFQSHESSRDCFKNSCPELDMLVEIARSHPSCIGARLTGGGFGGATINLVEQSGVRDFQSSVAARYQESTGRKSDVWICQIVDGAE
ncbi:MAG: galactokinase [Verrucomicrobia bacterium]|nr:galactokinase [Verrucomicrobiota bacterium]